MNCEKSFVMLSAYFRAYFLRKTHSIMTNCKFVIGNEVKHLGCAHVDVREILHVRSRMTIHQDFFANQFCFTIKKKKRPSLVF